MTEEHKNSGAIDAYSKSSWWGTIMKIILAFLLIVIVGAAGFVTYLQTAAFERLQKSAPAEVFADNIRDDLVYTDRGFMVSVPDEVIGTIATDALRQAVSDSGYTVENIYYDGSDSRFDVNLSHSGFFIPLSFKTSFIPEGNTIQVKTEQISIGIHSIKPFWPLDRLIDVMLPTEAIISLKMDTEMIPLAEHVHFSEAVIEEGIFQMYYTVDENVLGDMFDLIRTELDEDLVDAYAKSDDLNARKAAEWMSQVYPLSAEQRAELVNDLRSGQILTRQLLILAGDSQVAQVSEALKTYDVHLDTNQIALERKLLEGRKIDALAIEILHQLDGHFTEQFIAFNQGKPFDVMNHNTITLSELVTEKGIEVVPELIDKLTFVKKNGVGVAYELDEETVYVRYLDGYEIQNKVEFMTYEGAGPYAEAVLVEDVDLWNEVLDLLRGYFGVETVFIRYMKSDGDDTFVIASPEDDPQQYWKMALMRNSSGQIIIIDDDVKTVLGLFEVHPEFNIETATYEIETVTIYEFSETNLETILEDMENNNIIRRKSDYSIVYNSYDGKYIAIMLNTGKEYVYKVDGSYLQSVYTKEKALTNWTDMPGLILLQDAPE